MSNVLYAVGMVDSDELRRILEDNELGVQIEIVESIISAFEMVEKDPLRYQYVLICIKAFCITDGATIPEAFARLAELVKATPNTKFCFIDEERKYYEEYRNSCAPIPNIMYTPISKIQLRTFKIVLEKVLSGEGVKPKREVKVQSQAERPAPVSRPKLPVQQKPKSKEEQTPKVDIQQKKSGLFDAFKKPKKNEDARVVKEIAAKVEAIKEQKAQEVQLEPEEQEEYVEQEVQSTPKNEFKEINKQVIGKHKPIQIQSEVFKGRSILVTELAHCGSTTVALMLAKGIADSGLRVCYVEIGDKIPSSNAIFGDDDILSTGIDNILTALACEPDTSKYSEYVGIYKGVHIVRDGLLVEKTYTSSNLVRVVGSLNKMFDTVIYDINSSCIRDYSLVVSMITDKIIVTTNNYLDVIKTAISLKDMVESEKDSDYALYTMLTSDGHLIVNKYLKGCNNMEGGVISSSDVPSLVADACDEIESFELIDLLGTIPVSNDIAFDPFSNKSSMYVNEILNNMGVD